MISGYFQIRRGHFSVLKLVLQTVFYGWISIVALAVLYFTHAQIAYMSAADMVKSALIGIFNPATGGYWWFISAYLFMLLLSPLTNRLMNSLNRNGSVKVLAAMLVLWYGIGSMGSDYYSLLEGVLFYCVGVFIRLHGAKLEGKGKRTGIVLGIIALWILNAFMTYMSYEYRFAPDAGVKAKAIASLLGLLANTLLVPVSAVLIFRWFEGMADWHSEMVNRTARTVFGVYLLHDSPFARVLLWDRILDMRALYTYPLFPLIAIGCVLAVFVCCALADSLRIRWIEPGALKKAEEWKNRFRQKYVVSENT